jgi:hypothetical protein
VRGEYVILLNNDVQVTNAGSPRSSTRFRRSKMWVRWGPKILYPSGHLQEAGVALHADGSVEMVGLNDDPQRDRYNYAGPVDTCRCLPRAEERAPRRAWRLL